MPKKKLPQGQSIPLLPEQLPQQKLVLVQELPARPEGFTLVLGAWPESCKPNLRDSHTLCQLEWAWSPMNNRIQTWTITQSKCKRFYLLETGLFNDESLFLHYDEEDNVIDGPEAWEFHSLGYCEVSRGLSLREHATLLLHDALLAEIKDCDLDHYHWINSEDLLNCSDLEAIARSVWPECQQ